MRNLASL